MKSGKINLKTNIMKNLDTKRIADLHLQIAKEFDAAKPDPLPDLPPEVPEPIQPEPPPSSETMPVRVLFFGMNHSYKPPVDVMINGVWHDFSVQMDVKIRVNQAVGTLIHVNSPITTIAVAKSQIHNPNLNREGFGNTNIKYGAVPPEDDMVNINDSFWSRWVHCKANHTSYIGSLQRGMVVDPEFYKINVHPSFNDSGKFAIYVSGYGENAP